MPNIRSPYEKLAGCYHLARFTDKIRLHLANELPEDYQFAFCHKKGVDGTNIKHDLFHCVKMGRRVHF